MGPYVLASDNQMRAFGAALAPFLGLGDVIALHGGLGAGKTTLARGLISALCGPGTEVPSPTYTLVQSYEAPAGLVYHFDLYRLEDAAGLAELGWDATEDGIMLVEWPERAGAALPAWRLDVVIEPDPAGRRLVLEPRGEDWQKRLDDKTFRFPA